MRWKLFFRLLAEEDGIQHVEEALLLALIVLSVAGFIAALGDALESSFDSINDAIRSVLP